MWLNENARPTVYRPASPGRTADGMTIGYYVQGLRRYADFEGRASRAEFWWFNLVLYGIQIAIVVLGTVFSPALERVSAVMLLVHGLGTALPQLAVTARRLHDTGRSGWLMLLLLIPVIGWIPVLIFLLQSSDAGPNEYDRGPGRLGNYCTGCGSQNDDEARFCKGCGKAMSGSTPSAARPEPVSPGPARPVGCGKAMSGSTPSAARPEPVSPGPARPVGGGMTVGYYLQGLSRFQEFEGRASLAEFWWFTLVQFGINIMILVLVVALFGVTAVQITFWGLILVTGLPLLAAATRRLHDTGRSGWWTLFYLILMGWLSPLQESIVWWLFWKASSGIWILVWGLGWILCLVLLVVLFIFLVRPSDAGPNKYGRRTDS